MSGLPTRHIILCQCLDALNLCTKLARFLRVTSCVSLHNLALVLKIPRFFQQDGDTVYRYFDDCPPKILSVQLDQVEEGGWWFSDTPEDRIGYYEEKMILFNVKVVTDWGLESSLGEVKFLHHAESFQSLSKASTSSPGIVFCKKDQVVCWDTMASHNRTNRQSASALHI